ncbi:hypothetical protein [Haloarchaeobius sp. FL176]|uniref:hypothetical protein n=1 Tax=Haloarchaeobius sp. FL176 TaxID=2967129 RepID=UPI002147E365|nr:hypothetical protein [Haloarchaeobius sp. FL176]
MKSKKRSPEATLSIPSPGRHENERLKYLVAKRYLSLETVTFEFEEISTTEFAEARRKVAEAAIITPLHADLKAVATWFLQRKDCEVVTYEQKYPESARIADVACVPRGHYVEVGKVEDITRIYQMLGLDVISRGSEISSVLRRHPECDDPTKRGGVRAILSVPFPVDDEYRRAWEVDELAVHTYTLGNRPISTPNRRHRWWAEED